MFHLIQEISAVRLYLPKDLKPLDKRQSVGKSIQVNMYLLHASTLKFNITPTDRAIW